MKIAHVLPTISAGGAERMTAALASRMSRAGHDVTLLVGWPTAAEAAVRAALDPSVRVEYMHAHAAGRSTVARYLGALSWTWRARRRLYAFDVVHCHLTYGAFVGTVLRACRGMAASPRPAIVETYHAVGMRIPRLKRWVHALMAARRDALVLMASDPFWTDLAAQHRRLLTRTILNGATAPDLARISPSERSASRAAYGVPPDASFVVGTIGMLRSDRQPWLFLPIIERLVAQFGPGLHWLFAGDGPERARLEQEIHARGLAGHVHITGVIDNVAYPLSILDLHLTLTVGEVCGVAAMEAALAGVPVLGMQLLDGYVAADAPFIWSSADPQQVAGRAAALLRDGGERRVLAARQQRYAQQHHSVETMTRGYEEVYSSVLVRRGIPATTAEQR